MAEEAELRGEMESGDGERWRRGERDKCKPLYF
jgi:hypothetical protein